MPRWAARVALEVTEVRVQRLREITEDDARAEGVPPFFERYPSIGRDQRLDGELCSGSPHRACFSCVWDEVRGDRAPWSRDPWVWAVTFRQIAPAVPRLHQPAGGRADESRTREDLVEA
jgi:hypothetical protein